MQLTKDHKRLLYLLAKHGGPMTKGKLCTATHRMSPERRDQALAELHAGELIDTQRVPRDTRPGRNPQYIWLTVPGKNEVDRLLFDGVIELPSTWREAYG